MPIIKSLRIIKKGLKKYKPKPLKINNRQLARDSKRMQKLFEKQFSFVE